MRTEELRYLDLRLVSYPRMFDLGPEAIEEGLVYPNDYLADYLDYLGRFEQGVPIANCWRRIIGFPRERPFGTIFSAEKSSRVGPHHRIAEKLGLRGAVLLTGKLEGTEAHMMAVDYLVSHAPVILGIEQWEYYWLFSPDERENRNTPLFPGPIRASLWSYHPCIEGVFLVPPIRVVSEEEVSFFHDRLFNETGVDFACATVGDPHLDSKLKRGKVPVGRDWRVIPRFPFPSTKEILKTS